jgi:hypothetical protein
MEEQTHYIIRVGDGVNFINSSKYNCWGLNSNNNNTKHLLKNIKENFIFFIKFCLILNLQGCKRSKYNL